MGPFPRRQLVESLLALPEPRTSLVWRHGLPAWTPAGDVPEIERLLAPFAPAREPEAARESSATAGAGSDASGRFEARSGSHPRLGVPAVAGGGGKARSAAPLVYGGIAAAVLVLGLIAWLLWPREDVPAPSVPVTKGGTSSPASPGPNPGASSGPVRPGEAGFTGFADQEADLPTAELKRLRGVAGWSGEKLTITLYNGSNWRVTEILVRTSRLENDQFVDADVARRLAPAGAPLDAAVGEMLKKVAPDRKKAGVNPADTGPFEGAVGAQPQAYRWKIEGARGYPPRAGS